MSDADSAALIAVIAQLEDLLPRCGFDTARVKWLVDRRLALEQTSRPIAEVKVELRSIIAGMGSLLDPFITASDLSRERDRLADELHRLTAS